MSRELADFATYSRQMAARTVDPRDESRVISLRCDPRIHYTPQHDECASDACRCTCHPRHVPTDSERELWTRLADEVDAYLTPASDGPSLFDEET